MMTMTMTASPGAIEQFPVGLRVLVVDDDVTCLKILEHMLQRCRYWVTSCCHATEALSLLRERRGDFDVVISDVHMPDMDGFKLLELVGLEMDLPVIMMSADGGTHTVMQGIKHGACDYLIKPVRIEELKNIWQHVIRKKQNESRELEYSGSLGDSDCSRRVLDDAEHTSAVNDGADGPWKSRKKKRDAKEDEADGELDQEDLSSSKKARVVWSVELHQQFVSAVSQLGIEKAVPKRILELMNVPGITRENVASHLQKFRLYLKRISSVPQGPQPPNGFPSSLCGPLEPNLKGSSSGSLDFQVLAATGQIHPQTLAALHAEFLGHPSGPLVLPAVKGPKCIPPDQEVAFGQSLFKSQSNISKIFPPSVAGENSSSTFSMWQSNYFGKTDPTKNLGRTNNSQNGNMMMQQPNPVLSELNNPINVQPSCLIVPSRSSNCLNIRQSSLPFNQNSIVVSPQSTISFQSESTSVSINPNPDFNSRNILLDHCLVPSLSNSVQLDVVRTSNGSFTNHGVLSGSSDSISSPVSLIDSDWRFMNSNMNNSLTTGLHVNLPYLCTQGSKLNTEIPSAQRHTRNLGFVGKGTFIPSRFAVDDIEFPTNDQSIRNTCVHYGGRVKQEIHLDCTDSSEARAPILPHFSSSSNFMGVLSNDTFDEGSVKS